MSLEKLMEKHERLVMVNDIHVPFHDEKTLESVKYGLKYMKPDRLILGGDIIDFYSISHFDKDPSRALNLEDEINDTYDVLSDIVSVLPKSCKVSYLLGNHEERLQKYVHTNAPELHWVDGLKWNQMLGLHDLNIRPVNKRWMEHKGVMYSHLNRSNKYGGYTAKNLGTDFNRSIVHTHCFTDDVELLSNNGWITYDKVEEGITQVATLNKKTNKIEFNSVNELAIHNPSNLIKFKGRAINISVTPEHGMVESDRNGKIKSLPKANEIKNKEFHFMSGGENTFEDLPYTDDELRYIAWVITEGSLTNQWYGTRLYQSQQNDGRFEELVALLDRLGLKYKIKPRKKYKGSFNRNFDAYLFQIHKDEFTSKIHKMLLDSKKGIPKEFVNMNRRQFDIFLDVLNKADGHIYNDNCSQFSSKDELTIDRLQMMCAMNGMRTSKLKRERNHPDFKTNNPYYILNICDRKIFRLRQDNISKDNTDNKVWCVNVDNGTLLVRSKGKTIITQNTHKTGHVRHGNMDFYDNGCLCDLQPDYMSGSGPSVWSQAFMVVDYIGKQPHFTQIPIEDHKFVYDGRLFTPDGISKFGKKVKK